MTIPEPADQAKWDAFVDAHPEGRFSYLWGFQQTLERTYGYLPVCRRVLRDGKLAGIFPAVVAGRRRRMLTSLPFNEYGGPLVDGFTPDEWSGLALALKQLNDEHRCAGIEIRGGVGCDALAAAPVCTKHRLHQYAVLELREPQQLWKGSLTNEARKAVKRGQSAGLRVEISSGATAESSGEHFYQLYLVSMKRLGVPPHPRAFFQNLAACLGERLVCAAVIHQDRRIAYLVGAMTAKRFSVYITASAPEAWPLRPNDLAHWELIAWAFAKGAAIFDFGSARYPGQIHFKQKWGSAFYDYNYYLIGAPGSAAVSRVRSADSSSKLMIASANIWRRVMPLRLSSVLGPPIRKYLTK